MNRWINEKRAETKFCFFLSKRVENFLTIYVAIMPKMVYTNASRKSKYNEYRFIFPLGVIRLYKKEKLICLIKI